MHIKTIKVRNPKATVIQIPGFVAEKWDLQEGDGVEVHISNDEKSITLYPRQGFVQVFAGSRSDGISTEMVPAAAES